MAGTSVLKLKVDDREYNASLKQAQKGMQDLQQSLVDAGKSFTDCDSKVAEYARALGDMESTSRSAKGKISEMSSAFVELSTVYQKMTDQEKQSPVGQALAESLEKLRTRTVDAKTELGKLTGQLEPVSQETGNASSALDMLKDKLTVNIDAVKLFNAGLQAAEAVLNVAKDAFFNNEEQLDEWGRIVETSQSLYEGFLNALNTGDISGFLSNIGRIEQAARDAYDALDALGTFNAFNQINVERTRTGMTESIADYRGGNGSKEEVKAAGEAYKKELEDRKRLERDAYIAAVREMAAKRGVSEKDLRDALSGTFGHYQDLKQVMPSGTAQKYVPGLPGMPGRFEEYKVAQNDQERLGEALRHLNDTELQSLQALGAQAERTGNEIAQVDKQLTRVLNGKNGSGSGNNTSSQTKNVDYANDSIAYQEQEVQRLTKLWREAGSSVRDNYATKLDEAKYKLKVMNGQEKFAPERMQKIESPKDLDLTMGTEIKLPVKLDFGDVTPLRVLEDELARLTEGQQNFGATSQEAWKAYQQKIDETNEKIAEFKGKGVDDDAKSMTKNWSSAASAISAVGSAMSQIEDPAAKVMGTIAQAIATIALTFASSLKGTFTPWDWIAAAAAGTATMVSTIAAIKQATAGYAAGGVVNGNQYSGDNIPAMLNAGEVVLNHAQVNSLANTLQGTGIGNLNLSATVTGEQIRLVLNNNGMRTGRGEYITTNFS